MTQKIKRKIEEYGLLLEADPDFPSIVGMVTGEKVKGSWWGHRKGNEIFSISRQIRDDDDILLTKLISGKVTYVHKRLWNHLLTILIDKENWQVKNMSTNGENILKLIEEVGAIRADHLELETRNQLSRKDLNKAINEIEKRLLIFSNEVHTEKGTHSKQLKSWNHFIKEKDLELTRNPSALSSKQTIDSIVVELNNKFNSKAKLPWWTQR